MIRTDSERNYGCRIERYATYKGMRTIVLQNELIRLSILLDKGSDIYELLYKPRDIDFLWRSSIGIRQPSIVPSIPHPQGAFMDYYHGGWQELFPSASGPSFYQGAHLGLHGEVASCPWEAVVLQDEPEAIEVLFTVKTLRTPFILEKKIRLETGQPIIFIQERIQNTGKTGMHYMWGHHPSFGAPFLGEDCTLDLPTCDILTSVKHTEMSRLPAGKSFTWPFAEDKNGQSVDLRKIAGPETQSTDMFYATFFSEGWFALTNPRLGLGIGMVWPEKDFSQLWVWQEFGGTMGYPWYGNAYTMAIEPFSSRPGKGEEGLNEAIENDTAEWVDAGGEVRKELKVVVYESEKGVKRILPSGEVINR
jgi:galactose mutarotase-like enzyme